MLARRVEMAGGVDAEAGVPRPEYKNPAVKSLSVSRPSRNIGLTCGISEGALQSRGYSSSGIINIDLRRSFSCSEVKLRFGRDIGRGSNLKFG
jgi:hypothetical protein